MFQSYQALGEFEQKNLDAGQLSIEQKLAILDGMVKHTLLLRPNIFADEFAGIMEKIEFIKLLHSVQRPAR